MASDPAPGWFHERIADVNGSHAAPLTERELAAMIGPLAGPGSLSVRAAAEILRLRKQLKTIFHSAPARRGKKLASNEESA